ncbi:agmatine deiminase [Lewinella marina]|uniref:Agmatine deiminase n=1 Tax=Neolewinella marina TaxID=438751 RepID=A0A2G0CFL4_9BACT|nr:agmatine deiminase family protein [Neolewinella marina]NJB85549.1 agmatine deiminase [Neolewinella marina]PHK98764.1 agmatine deiminase [Neolewinella marina]
MRRLPAEWEPQQLVLFSFPRREGDWGEVLEDASAAMIAAANAVHEACPTRIVVGDREHFERYADRYRGEVSYWPTDDSWIRDSGPITVVAESDPTLLDFTFNGWGGKFDARRDNELPRIIHEELYPRAAYARVPLVLEGGAIESDGRGTILTTSRCLLSTGRNDYRDKAEAEAMLRDHLGAERIIWLDYGELLGDDTDAHVDTVARFLDAETIAYVGPPPESDPQHADFTAMRRQLREAARGYRLVELPWTGHVSSRVDGHRLPASYANFLISNGSLFVPTYGTEADQSALEVLRQESPYRVVGVNCLPFVEQHGALHCLTMQIPDWENPEKS